GAHIVKGGEPVVKAMLIGESNQDINDLVQSEAPAPKSGKAREIILDTLEAAPDMEMESDALDAMVAEKAKISAFMVKKHRGKLKAEGLIKPVPVKDESETIRAWRVRRTNAPRPEKRPERTESPHTKNILSGFLATPERIQKEPERTKIVSG